MNTVITIIGCVEINKQIVYFSASYITDALGDLLKALIALAALAIFCK